MNMNINLDTIKMSERSFDPIPAGKYPARVASAEVKETNNKLGQYIKVEFEILGEKYANRKIFNNFNIKNPSAVALQIGLEQLKEFCAAIGISGNLTNTNQVLNKNLIIDLRVKKSNNPDYPDDYNEVKKFIAINGSESPKTAAPASQPIAGSNPWSKATQ